MIQYYGIVIVFFMHADNTFTNDPEQRKRFPGQPSLFSRSPRPLAWPRCAVVIIGFLALLTVGMCAYLQRTRDEHPTHRTISPSLVERSGIAYPTTHTHEAAMRENAWKTYVNRRYGYSIQYPGIYTPYGVDKSGPLRSTESASLVLFTDYPLPSVWSDQLPAALTISVMTEKQFAREENDLDDATWRAPCAGCPLRYTTTIHGNAATIYDGYGGYTIDKIYILKYREMVYEVRYNRSEDPKRIQYPYATSEAMVSTFQFLK